MAGTCAMLPPVCQDVHAPTGDLALYFMRLYRPQRQGASASYVSNGHCNRRPGTARYAVRNRGLTRRSTASRRVWNPVDCVYPCGTEVFEDRENVLASMIASLLPFPRSEGRRAQAEGTLDFNIAFMRPALRKYIVAQLLPRHDVSGPARTC